MKELIDKISDLDKRLGKIERLDTRARKGFLMGPAAHIRLGVGGHLEFENGSADYILHQGTRFDFVSNGGIRLRVGDDGFVHIGGARVYFGINTTDYVTHAGTFFSFVSNNLEVMRLHDTRQAEVFTGTAADPGWSFIGRDDLGAFSPAANTYAISTAGIERVRVVGTTVRLNAEVLAFNNVGTSEAWIQFEDHGMDSAYVRLVIRDGGDVSEELFRVTWNNATDGGIISQIAFVRNQSGTTALPSYSFVAQTNMGLYRNGTNDVRLVTNGTWGLAVLTNRAYANMQTGGGATAVSHTNNQLISGAASRREWKFGITPVDLDEAIAIISQLQPVTHHYRKEHATADGPLGELTEYFGMIAQDVDTADRRLAVYGHLAEDGWGTSTLNDTDKRIKEAEDEDREPTPYLLEDMVPVNWDHKQVTTLTVAALQGLINREQALTARVLLLEDAAV